MSPEDLELPPFDANQEAEPRTSEDISTPGNGSGGQRQVKKRNRIPVSCNECRRRKLRCDRKDPCSACVQRGDPDGCKFTEPLTSQPKSRPPKPGSRDFLQQRIHRLESLVTDLAAQVRHTSPASHSESSSQSPDQRTIDQSEDVSSQTSPATTEEPRGTTEPIDDLKIAMGDMKISNGKVVYTSGNSWNTILDEIADIKLAMNPVYSSYTQHKIVDVAPQRPSSFPFFAVQTPSTSDLLALLPSRLDTEMLVHKFLTSMLTMCPCLHRPTFLRDLAEFYAAPDKCDPIFLGTLFAVLACAISIYTEDEEPTRNALLQKGVSSKKDMANVWRDASMQAFCLGSFLTLTTLENLQGLIVLHTFLNNFQAGYSLGWPLYGMIISIALNMGLHRDGALFGLDPFETEMRRRLWSILVMVDGLNAASYGRPMMISDTQFDTKPLASMYDSDLRPGCKLPPPLPPDPEQITDTTYARCKYMLAVKIRQVISSLFGLHPPSYDTIMKFDQEIRDTYDKFPEAIKYRPDFKAGGVTLCVQRLGLKIIMNHALVILHRPFLHRSFRNQRYLPSREKCLDAAHVVIELFLEYRNNLEYVEYSWYALGSLHAFHAGTVVGLRCYLEPLTCDQRDWVAIDQVRTEFEKIQYVDGWNKFGEKATKVSTILIRKALEKKAILEGALGVNGITIGPSSTTPQSQQPAQQQQQRQQTPLDRVSPGGSSEQTDFTTPLFSTASFSSDSGSTGVPSYRRPPPIPGTSAQYVVNPLTNPNLQSATPTFEPRQLQGVGMPGVVSTDSSPEQNNWDTFWPKSMNLSEWDMFFENMDIDMMNSDSLSSNPAPAMLFADQANPFSNSTANAGNNPMEWDFGNATFGPSHGLS